MTVEAVETVESSGLVIDTGQGVDQLRDAIAAVALATNANKYAPPILRAIRLEIEDGHLVLVATDRFRLHVARVPVSGEIEPVSVGAKELTAWAKNSAKGACHITIKRTEHHVELDTQHDMVRLMVDGGEYPKWRSLIDTEAKREPVEQLSVNGSYLHDMAKACALANWEKSPRITLQLTGPNKPMITEVKGKRFKFTGLLMPIRITD